LDDSFKKTLPSISEIPLWIQLSGAHHLKDFAIFIIIIIIIIIISKPLWKCIKTNSSLVPGFSSPSMGEGEWE